MTAMAVVLGMMFTLLIATPGARADDHNDINYDVEIEEEVRDG